MSSMKTQNQIDGFRFQFRFNNDLCVRTCLQIVYTLLCSVQSARKFSVEEISSQSTVEGAFN